MVKKGIVRMSAQVKKIACCIFCFKLKIDQKGLMEMVRVGKIVWVQGITKIGF